MENENDIVPDLEDDPKSATLAAAVVEFANGPGKGLALGGEKGSVEVF